MSQELYKKAQGHNSSMHVKRERTQEPWTGGTAESRRNHQQCGHHRQATHSQRGGERSARRQDKERGKRGKRGSQRHQTIKFPYQFKLFRGRCVPTAHEGTLGRAGATTVQGLRNCKCLQPNHSPTIALRRFYLSVMRVCTTSVCVIQYRLGDSSGQKRHLDHFP